MSKRKIKHALKGLQDRRPYYPPGICRVCGCTEELACMDDKTGEPCKWTDETKSLCTACK